MRKKITDFAKKQLKDSFMGPTNDKNRHAETIIRNHVLWSMGASYIIPLPIADVFAVSALQLDMIRQLTRVYDIDFAETQGKAIVSSLTTSTMARAGARSLIKLVPGIGTIIGGITTAAVNGASTYALGEVFKQHFAHGGTFLDFDTDRLKKLYNESFEKGKDVAKDWKKEADNKGESIVPPTSPKPASTMPTGFNPTPPPTTSAVPDPGSPGHTPQATAAADLLEDPSAPTKSSAPATAPINDAAIRKIKELAEMKAQNIITQEEFEVMKKRILG
ncbi:DUF697 domain-containing protein [Neolewinella antarctica]|uniref:Uncharacterized protein (DUF697 family) n=1 Tax=Neolewinella antarctica TaxID=442734 RepID=A0ABX0XET5_9BACT|nr:DUF697 domain-containing protein [Neolewinella antarctica]NJC27834.1 uncharacterized protein (DUF697 family) [Neolewinella antarctica]